MDFIPASFYQNIYMILVTLLTYNVSQRYKVMTTDRLVTNQPWLSFRGISMSSALIVCVLFTLFIGLRPVSYVFCDMANYATDYDRGVGGYFAFDWDAENKIWDNLFAWWTANSLGFNNLMLLMCALNFGCTFAACRRLFPNDTLIAFLVFLGAFSTFTYAVNGVKAGTAAAVFLLAVSYYKNWKICIPLLLAAYGFHHSMIMPVGSFVIACFYKNSKVLLGIWIVCVVISALHITWFQELFATMSADRAADARGADYLMATGDDAYITGFRPDFILYSAAPVIVGRIAILRKNIRSEFYEFFLNLYIITNSIWMLCMYASYSNRIAYLSWGLYPLVLIYPFLKEKWGEGQYRTFYKVVWYHLGFTLVMEYIYYGLLK